MTDDDQRERIRATLAAASLERGIDKLGMERPASQAIAAEIGCEVDEIAMPHVFEVRDRGVVVVMSGDSVPDRDKLATALGGAVREADQGFVRAIAEWTIRDRPPPKAVTPIDVLIDANLYRFDQVWVVAGSPRSVFPMEPARLREMCGATEAEL